MPCSVKKIRASEPLFLAVSKAINNEDEKDMHACRVMARVVRQSSYVCTSEGKLCLRIRLASEEISDD